MACEEWSEPISAYVDGECDLFERQRVSDHLSSCAPCRLVVDRADRMRRRLLVAGAETSEDLRRTILGAHEERTMVRSRIRRRAAVGMVASLLAVGVSVAILQDRSTSEPDPPQAAAAVSADHEVLVDQVSGDASHRLHIRSGETVAWRNAGAEPHALVHQIDGTTVMGSLEPGQSEAITFDSPGSYAYRCTIHEGIQGEVHVSS